MISLNEHIAQTSNEIGYHSDESSYSPELLEARTLKGILTKYRIGIYVAIIVTMLLTIFLLAYKISAATAETYNFSILSLLDDEVVVEPEVEETHCERLEEEVEALLRETRPSTSVRNVVVNTQDQPTSTLIDSKGINNSVYEEARQLQERMDANRRMMEELQTTDNSVPVQTETPPAIQETYQGPSVLTYTLDGRRAIYLSNPAYKCERGGDITVNIEVNQNGYVVSAEIDKAKSIADPNLQAAAIQAAKSSRFTASYAAPKKQKGVIVYRFIPQ
ncbi:MAG: energy transducer TonB [Prevotellaceae bacterium]|jgi:TonB family protein|nr:energy transducer TonB [Prevotellaceae bacterium]